VINTYVALASIHAVQSAYAVGIHWWPLAKRPQPDA
jgi:hypothetical protein